MDDLATGLRVCDVRGLLAGRVHAVHDQFFAISQEPAVTWLPRSAIWTIESGIVTLEFNLSSLQRRQVNPPDRAV
jgi:hypothetical protein